jgi:hypothetical protein
MGGREQVIIVFPLLMQPFTMLDISICIQELPHVAIKIVSEFCKQRCDWTTLCFTSK